MSEVKSHTDVEVGDKIVVSRYNYDLCQRKAVVTDINPVTIDVQFCDGGELAILYKDPTGMDVWEYASEDYVQHEEEAVVLNRDVKVGDKIAVTMIDGVVL